MSTKTTPTFPLDLTKPVQTRGGHKVTIFVTDGRGTYPIKGVLHGAAEDSVMAWTKDGRASNYGRAESPLDLVNVQPKKTLYVNVYRSPKGFVYIGGSHTRRDTADRAVLDHAEDERIARLRFDIDPLAVYGRFDE